MKLQVKKTKKSKNIQLLGEFLLDWTSLKDLEEKNEIKTTAHSSTSWSKSISTVFKRCKSHFLFLICHRWHTLFFNACNIMQHCLHCSIHANTDAVYKLAAASCSCHSWSLSAALPLSPGNDSHWSSLTCWTFESELHNGSGKFKTRNQMGCFEVLRRNLINFIQEPCLIFTERFFHQASWTQTSNLSLPTSFINSNSLPHLDNQFHSVLLRTWC